MILDGARTPIERFQEVSAHELGAVVREAPRRAGVDGGDVDDVSLAAGLDVGVLAYNVNRPCGSGLQAIWGAAMQLKRASAGGGRWWQ